jgi:uroporphyrinogen-III synthase
MRVPVARQMVAGNTALGVKQWRGTAMAILLLTRPAAASARTRAEIARLRPDTQVVISPAMEIVPVPAMVGEFPAGLILTSENGAEVAGQVGLPPGMVAWCVGTRTAEVAEAAGFAAVNAEGDAEVLLRAILSAPDAGPLLHLRGEHARGDIAPRLRAAGRMAHDLVVYRQEEQPLSAEAKAILGGATRVVLPLYSPRTAAIVAEQGPFSAPLHVIAISAAAARAAERLEPERISQIDNPDGQSMLSAIVDSLAD